MERLEEAIESYKKAIENLDFVEADDYQSRVLNILTARDNVAQILNEIRSLPINSNEFSHLGKLDQLLKNKAKEIIGNIGRTTFVNFQKTILPPVNSWWWFLDELQFNPIWTILAGIFITLSLTFTVEISGRFLGTGPNFIGVFSTVSQVFLTLLASSTFTKIGREWIEKILFNVGFAWKFREKSKAGFSLGVLIIVLALRFSLPSIAIYYNNWGLEFQKDRDLANAISHYQRAISLNPDYAEAHYSLGNAYEDLFDYERALSEYRVAVSIDDKFYDAYNNLARLYILHKKDYARALKIINKALELEPNEKSVLYIFHLVQVQVLYL